MRKINKLVIHCAATPEDVDFDVNDIRSWHLQNGWSDVGYHFIIKLDGTIQLGRNIELIGAHVRGHNYDSIGVCYIGGVDINGKSKDTRTEAQKKSLKTIIAFFKLINKGIEILGHRDFEGVKKDCPSFDAKKEYNKL